jgi:hypothetical protein
MATSKDFSAEEWKSVEAAPLMAGLVVTMSDVSGPIGLAREALAVGRVITESPDGTTSELIRSLTASFKSGSRPEMPSLPKDREQARTSLLERCAQAVSLVSAKSPAEAQEFRLWLMSIARKAADAAKEGGILGFGGTRVSESEQTALTQLEHALGASA